MHGKASLSRHSNRRFGHHLPYRATQDDQDGGHVAVMHHAAAIAGPTPDGEGQLRADVAARRADARAAPEAGVDVPRPACPLGLVAEDAKHPAQARIGQRTRHAALHERPRGLVDVIAPRIGHMPVQAAQPRHRPLAVHAAPPAPVPFPVEPPDALGGSPSQPGVRDARAVAQGRQRQQPVVDANHGVHRLGINLGRGLELRADRFLGDGHH